MAPRSTEAGAEEACNGWKNTLTRSPDGNAFFSRGAHSRDFRSQIASWDLFKTKPGPQPKYRICYEVLTLRYMHEVCLSGLVSFFFSSRSFRTTLSSVQPGHFCRPSTTTCWKAKYSLYHLNPLATATAIAIPIAIVCSCPYYNCIICKF